MSAPIWSDVRELFERVLDAPQDARAGLLAEARARDPALVATVEEMVAAHAGAGAFLEPPTPEDIGGAMPAGPTSVGVGDTIDGFRLLSVLGSGGMGTVYEAEQDRPRRRVALKVLNRRLDSPLAARRFQDEAEVLASLRHPSIAQVHASGTWTAGTGTTPVPWFALELVEDARPITVYARERRLPLRVRLALFLDVCDAVHHGHQRGVIHRDIKPANVLVDGAGNVRVIDFGVAKVAGSDTDRTAATRAGEIVGTLATMSPEQLLGGTGSVDTRTDVYGLGLLLYELLADRPAFDLAETPLPEVVRIVREEQPPAPGRKAPDLPRELDAITLTAIEKERERRYAGASELAADVRRFLADEPVVAAAPGALDVARKFVRRHKVGVTAAALVLAALVAGLATSLHFLFVAQEESARADGEATAAKEARDEAISERDAADRARAATEEARREADDARGEAVAALADSEEARAAEREAREEAERERDAADAARALAESQARRAEATASVFREALLFSDVQHGGRDVRVIDVLQGTVRSLDEGKLDDPLAEGPIRSLLAQVFREYGDYETAVAQAERAVAVLEDAASDSLELTDARFGLAMAFFDAGRMAESATLLRALRNSDATDKGVAAAALGMLGWIARQQGRIGECEALCRQALAEAEQLPVRDEALELNMMVGVADALMSTGRTGEALTLSEQIATRTNAAFGPRDPRSWLALWGLAVAFELNGHQDEALRLMQGSLAGLAELLTDVHPVTRDKLHQVGYRLVAAEQYEEGAALYRRTVDSWSQSLSPVDRSHVAALDMLAQALLGLGEAEQALAASEKAQALVRLGALAPGDPIIGRVNGRHAQGLIMIGHDDEAEAELIDAIGLVAGGGDAYSDERNTMVRTLVRLYERTGRKAEAAIWRAQLPDR